MAIGAAGKRKRKKPVRKARGPSSRPRAGSVRDRARAIFDQQIDACWRRLADACEQFARGYNHEIGAHDLQLQVAGDTLLMKFIPSDGELLVQLDRSRRQIDCWMKSDGGGFGSSVVDQLATEVMVQTGQLRLALLGEITVKDGAGVEHNFDDYPVLRIHQAPKNIFIYFVAPSAEVAKDLGEVLPTGVGEVGVPPVAPALANAIFAAGGPRIREIPFYRQVTIL